LDEMLSTVRPEMDWRVAAAALAEQYPERWGRRDPTP
jgi:hypothetical protein